MKVRTVTVSSTSNLKYVMKEFVKLVLWNEDGPHAEINAPTNPGDAESKLELVPTKWNAECRAEGEDNRKGHFDDLCILHAQEVIHIERQEM